MREKQSVSVTSMVVRRARGSLSRHKKEGETGNNALGMFACMTSLSHYPTKGFQIETETQKSHQLTPTHYPQVVKLSGEGVCSKEHLCRGSVSRRNEGTG